MGDTTTQSFRATPHAGHVDVLPAKRLANAIGTIKAAETADLMAPEDPVVDEQVDHAGA